MSYRCRGEHRSPVKKCDTYGIFVLFTNYNFSIFKQDKILINRKNCNGTSMMSPTTVTRNFSYILQLGIRENLQNYHIYHIYYYNNSVANRCRVQHCWTEQISLFIGILSYVLSYNFSFYIGQSYIKHFTIKRANTVRPYCVTHNSYYILQLEIKEKFSYDDILNKFKISTTPSVIL